MIFNQTTNTVISRRERYCRTFFSQLRGLMFRRKQNLVMIFPDERKVSLHMFFVFYPIDVLILNRKREIVEIKRNLKPFRVWSSSQKGEYVVELSLPHQEASVGERIEIKGK